MDTLRGECTRSEDVFSKGLIAFSSDLEKIEQFLDSVHEIAVSKAVERMKKVQTCQ